MMLSPFKIVIPARYGSSRLPGKPLLDIAGRPMIAHVAERALQTGAEVMVATDDERICAAVSHLPVLARMTRADHGSGTERIAEVAESLNWQDDAIVVNLQGDEPLMQPQLITRLAHALMAEKTCEVATLATAIRDIDEVFDPNTVKTVLNRQGHALYFSRAPIPWNRDTFPVKGGFPPDFTWLRHIGIYAYSVGFLKRYIEWSPSRLEIIEALEQLRILWFGESIRVLEVDEAPHAGVDTEADLKRVQGLLEG